MLGSAEIRDFLESRIWGRVTEELDEWLNQIGFQCTDPDGSMEVKVIHRLGGCAEAIRRVKSLPEVLLLEALDNEEERTGE